MIVEILVDLPQTLQFQPIIDLLVELVEVIDHSAVLPVCTFVVVRDMPVSDLKVAEAEPALREDLYLSDLLHDHQQVLRWKVVVECSGEGQRLVRLARQSDQF